MLRRKTGYAWLWLGVLLCALSNTAQAGPMEILNAASISPANPDNLVLSYSYGNFGVFVSQDGSTFKWLCSGGVDNSVSNRTFIAFASGDGSIYLGASDGLVRGDADGCNFKTVPELEKKWIRAIASDPIDHARTYVTTSNPMVDNGIYMRDGSGEFAPFGAPVRKYIATLHVVKVGDKRRFYETGVVTNLETNTVEYSVRVSDDDGMTWSDDAFDTTQFPIKENVSADFQIVAIDPQNPDHVVAHMRRHMKAADTLVFSKDKGRPGTWEKLAEVVELGGVVFAPDGTLYYGDDDFATKGLYTVAGLGEQPKQVTDKIRITCLAWDESAKRLLGCSNNYHFGPIDTATGVLTPLLDLRCAEHAVECADKPDLRTTCEPPVVEYCKLDHWLLAPLCRVYDRGADCATYASAAGYTCEGGHAVPSSDAADAAPTNVAQVCSVEGASGAGAAGEGGKPAAAGSGGATAGRAAAAGSAAGSGGSAGGSQSGCSCTSVGGANASRLSWLGACGMIAGLGLRARRRGRQLTRPR